MKTEQEQNQILKKELERSARLTGKDVFVEAYKIITEQEKEIERLKEENDTNTQYIRMMGIQSHIKTSNERVKQAQIDILNKAKEKLDSAPNGWAYTGYIDYLIEEVEK